MKSILHHLALLALAGLLLSACAPTGAEPTAAPGDQLPSPSNTPIPPGSTPPETTVPPEPTSFTTTGWSTTASTRTELSFAFPGEWDGSSPLTFGEGEFVKDPDQPLGVTFQIDLGGDPAALLADWGTREIGIIGIFTFTPESVTDGPNVTIARVDTPTKIAQGNGITAQVAYLQRADDTLEVMWFAPSEQWETLQPVFLGVLENVEMWNKYANQEFGLQTMYVHDWLAPQTTGPEPGLWFRSADEGTGMMVYVHNEIADPIQLLAAWNLERLTTLGLGECSLGEGDRMDTMSGQWESKSGECANAAGGRSTYEISFVPNKDRLIEIITYAPADSWEQANLVAFRHLLGMMTDIRP